jgi:hypothetical protein
MEKDLDIPPTLTYEDHILCKLYGAINTKNCFEKCIWHEWQFSIKYEYELNHLVVGKESELVQNLASFVEFLPQAYENIVKPMVKEIKDVME